MSPGGMNFFLFWLRVLLMVTLGFGFAEAQEKPSWIKHHEEYVKETGDKEWAEWVKHLSAQSAIELGKAWEEFMGFTMPAMVARSKSAPKIKPGVTITPENFQDFPGLEELLPPCYYKMMFKGGYSPCFDMIRVRPTTHLYLTKNRQAWSRKNLGKTKIGTDDELLNWEAGIPFPKPTNGIQVAQNALQLGMNDDQSSYAPVHFYLYDRNGKKERHMKINLYWKHYRGRTDIPPIPCVPGQEDVVDKGSIVAFYPFDVRGFSGVRTRHLSAEKEDEFVTYIPALRRIRRMSGSDVQDPLLGSDIPWDDWNGYWSRISSHIWRDVKFKLVGKKELLHPIYWNKPYRFNVEKGQFIMPWERRFCWEAEIAIGDHRHQYSKRKLYTNIENGKNDYVEMYDKRGTLWRAASLINLFIPETGVINAWGCNARDELNLHRSPVKFDTTPNDSIVTHDFFNLRFLTKMAR